MRSSSDILDRSARHGQNLEFLTYEGPWLSPRPLDAALDGQRCPSVLMPFIEPLPLCDWGLKPLYVSFAGSPWTQPLIWLQARVAVISMIQGRWLTADPTAFQAIIAIVGLR
jgi:hypothetical protein